MATSSSLFSLQAGPQSIGEQPITSTDLKSADVKTLNLHLAAIHDFSREIKLLINDARKDALLEETKRKLLGVHASFEFIGHLSQSIEKKGLKKELERIAVLGMAASEICHAGVQLQALESVAAFGPGELKAVAAAAGAALAIFNMCKKKKKDKSDSFANILIQGIDGISNQLLNLHKEMRESFVYLSAQVTDMHIDMRELFNFSFQLLDNVLKNQQIIHQVIDERFNRVDKGIYLLLENNKVLLENIKQVDSNMRVMHEKVDAISSARLLRLLNEAKAIHEGELSVTYLEKILVDLSTWREQASFPAYNGSIYLDNLEDVLNNRLRTISANTTMIHFGFLFDYAKLRLGLRSDISSVFNPMLWSKLTKNYINLKVKFPAECVDKNDQILMEANNQIKATKALRSVTLFQSLFDQYQKTLHSISQFIHKELETESKLFNEKEIHYKHTAVTPPFNIANNLYEIINEWKETQPCGRYMEGYNVGFMRNMIEYNDAIPVNETNKHLLPLLTLAERLNKINFCSQLKYDEVALPTAIITAMIGFRYGAESYNCFHHRQYNTAAGVNPLVDGNHIREHWLSKTFRGDFPVAFENQEEHIDKIKTLIFEKFLHYRKKAFQTILNHPEFNQLLKQLDACRHLLMHYSIAAGFKAELTRAIAGNFLGSHHIVFEIKKYWSEIDKDDILEVANYSLPIPFFSTETKMTAADIIHKIQSNNSSDFEEDILGNVEFIISDLQTKKYSRTVLESKSMLRTFTEAPMPSVDITKMHLYNEIAEPVGTRKEFFKIVALVEKTFISLQEILEKIDFSETRNSKQKLKEDLKKIDIVWNSLYACSPMGDLSACFSAINFIFKSFTRIFKELVPTAVPIGRKMVSVHFPSYTMGELKESDDLSSKMTRLRMQSISLPLMPKLETKLPESKSPKSSTSPKTFFSQTVEEKKIGRFADRITVLLGFEGSSFEKQIKNNLKQLLLEHKKNLMSILSVEKEKSLADQLAKQLKSFSPDKLQNEENGCLYDCIARWVISHSNEMKIGTAVSASSLSSERASC